VKRAADVVLLSGLIALLALLSGCASSNQPIAVMLTPNSAQGMDQAQKGGITAAVVHDPKNAGVAWTMSGAGTLSGQTTTSATYNAPSSGNSPTTATVTATSISDPTKSASLTFTVNPLPIAVTTTSLTATAGTAYSGTLSVTGGTSPYTWAVTAGSLPPGLSLNASTGAITGTPTGGSGSVTFQATDSSVAGKMTSAPQTITITVNPPPALTITTTALPGGTTGTAYSQTLQATGGVPAYTWSVSAGSLPAGLSLSSAGVISGSPSGTFTGTTNFTATATDSQTPAHATTTANLSITVTAPPLSVTTTSLSGGSIGNVYPNQTLQATGGIKPYSWAVTTGSLPAGLSLNSSTGVISGTPSGTFVGTDSFTVTVTDSETPAAKTANANLSITITVAPLSVTTSGALPTGVVNSVYAGVTLQATGGIQPYSWAVTTGSLPLGLTLNSATGAIAGTPTTAGTSNFTVTVTDSETPTAKTATANLSITVNPALMVTTTSLPAGVIGTAYSQALAATGGVMPYTWAVTTGTLPAGLSLNAATGAISGTPTGTFTGTTNFTVTVTDSESPTKKTASANLSITISAPALKVTTTSLPGGSIGTAYPSQTLQASGGVGAYTWAVTVGSLPPGLILNATTGVISGTPSGTFVGTDNFTVTVTDSETPTPQTANAALSITITVAPLSVTTSGSLPTGVVGSVYPGATLQATGGIQPYSWAVTTGSLPLGLTLNSATGAISGTPTTAGTSNFTVTVTDSETPTAKTATANLSIIVNPAVTVTTTSLPAGVIGTAYPGATLQATGGITPYTWAVTTGSLPAGLSLNASTGAISGTPTGNVTGTINFTVTVTDSESPKKTASANLSITITATALKVTTTSLPGGSIGTAYPSQTLQATGGITPYSWAVTVGSLPAGLSLNPATGVISGTPSGTFVGTDSFTVTVTDTETPTPQTANAALSITITVAPLSVTTTSLPGGVVGSVYAGATLQAAGGIQPYSWAVTTGSLPAGLTLNSATGAIAGTPAASGTSNFTVTVTDSETPTAKTATANLSITVNPVVTVTTTSLPAGVIGTVYPGATLQATGGVTPYSWAVTTGSLPAGLSLNAATGAISGTPTGNVTGVINFTVTVTDSESPKKTASANLSITISATTLKVTTASLPGGSIGTAYSQTLAATGGITPYTWAVTVGSLPTGLSLNSATGVISGTPSGTFTGTDSFTVTVTDSETPTPQTANAALSITITVVPLSVTTSGPLPTGVVGSVYPGATLQATGGIQPYSWAVTTGSLPLGLTLNSATGAISGTPTTAGTSNFTVTVTDSETPTAKTATANLSITVNPALTVTTNSLASGVIGVSYSQTLAATGGITPYTWAVTSDTLPAGLSLNTSTGVISGTPGGSVTGTTNFTVTVTDSESPTKKTASANLSITITAPTLKVTTTSLPNGVTGNSYSATLQASGGITPYSWQLTSGSLPTGLTLNSNGTITGTPAQGAVGTFNFSVKVTDSETPTAQTASASLSIFVSNSAPLTVTTNGLPSGVVGMPYQNENVFLQASGGVQPYTWSISSGSLPAGLSLSSANCGSNVNCAIVGTPTTTGTSNFTVKVTDSTQPNPTTATANLSITINGMLSITTASVPNGSLNAQYNATISATGGLQPYSWSIISGSLPPGLSPNSNNNSLNINGTPNTTGSYTFTVQVSDSENPQVSVSKSYTIVINSQPVGYTVSGTVSYSGSQTGWTYLQLNGNNNCGNCGNNLGTGISEATLKAGGAFTIHGVQPGTYTLQAYMDNLNPAFGAENAANPMGSYNGTITVTNANVSGVPVVLTDPGPVTLNSAPSNKGNGGGFNGGALVSFKGIQNNNGIEMATSYTVQWSTSQTFSSVLGSKSFPATGGNNPWIINGLTNGQTLFFRAEGLAGGSTSPWSGASNGILIGAPTGGNTVSGTVTFSETATGPLYVGFYDQGTGNVYADVVGSKANPPKSPAAYTVQVPNGNNYFFFGILDQNNSGLIAGPGQVSNTSNGNHSAPVVINGNLSNENLTLPNANSTATVTTQVSEQINQNGTNTYYSIGFNVNGLIKLPVAVELATGPAPGVVIPADIANGGFYGNSDSFSLYTTLNGVVPQVGDTYTLNVTYSDGTSEVLTVKVTAVLNNAFVTNLVPQGNGVSVMPDFSWTDPGNATNYTYQFWLCCDQNNNTIWQIPGNNSNSNGFSSSITLIKWNQDPTNSNPPDLPDMSSLIGNTTYSWQITAQDNNGNSAQVQVNFQTAATPLTLQASGALASGTVGQNYNSGINASGGTPNYTFYLNNGSQQIPTDGSQYSIADGIWVSSNGGSTLSVGGTPGSTGTVTIPNVTVMDSMGNTAGPDTYTIVVSPAQALSIQTMSLPGAFDGWAYNTYIQANGGVQPYTWSIISGGNSLTAVGLTFTNNPQNNQSEAEISGTPSATGTASFTVQVTDNQGTTLTQPLTLAVTGCTNNSNLSGNYAMLIQGWTDASQGEVFLGLAASFVTNGSGSITSGVGDYNDPTDGYAAVTITGGTYCVAGNDQGLMTINTNQGSLTLAFALQSSGNGNVIAYQANNGFQGSGVLLKQTASAFSLSKITGPYAVGLIGIDQGGNRLGSAGAFTANGTANWTNGQVDVNDNGNVNNGNGASSPLSFSSNNVSSISSTTGRGTVGINVAGVGTFNYAFYMVNATQLLLIETDVATRPNGSLLTGQILQQSGTFTDASLNGVSVLEAEGLNTGNSPATPVATVGLITTTGTGLTYSFSGDQNDGGTEKTQSDTGTFSVAPNGRTPLTSSGGGNSPLLYLIAKNQAFLLNTNGKVSFGMLTPQQAITFTDSSFSGNYLGGSQQPVNSNVKAGVIQLDATGAGGTLTGTQYQVDNCGPGCLEPESQTLSSITYAPDPDGLNGKFDISQDGQLGVYLYLISTTQGVFMNVGTTGGGPCSHDCNPGLTDVHQ